VKREDPNSSSTRRDIAGAWLLCAVIAALALGVMNNLRRGMPPAATVVLTSSCPPGLQSACPSSPEPTSVGAAAGLHRLALPEQRSDGQYHRG
jgi:hypothetical protein